MSNSAVAMNEEKESEDDASDDDAEWPHDTEEMESNFVHGEVVESRLDLPPSYVFAFCRNLKGWKIDGGRPPEPPSRNHEEG